MSGVLLLPSGDKLLTADGSGLIVAFQEVEDDPIYGRTGNGYITWVSPPAGLLTTQIELASGDPVWSTTFTATSISGTSDIEYIIIAGDAPEYYTLTNNPSGNDALFEIKPLVRELDEYVEGFEEPPNFTYDQDDHAGANYATYGSALAYSHTFTFTIRAYATADDSNYVGGVYEDRIFSVTILNNYSSDRDRFILKYYGEEKQQTLQYNGEELEPEDFLIEIKDDGYYN